MASIVLTPVRRLLLAALGFPMLLAPCRLAAGPGAVALATVAATTDGERSPAAPAVAQVKNRNLARQHRSLQPWLSGQPLPACARLLLGTLEPRFRPQRDRGNEPKSRRLPGFFLAHPTRPSIPPPHAPSPLPNPHPLPPRFARDDDGRSGMIPDLKDQIPTDRGERPHCRALCRASIWRTISCRVASRLGRN